MVNNKVILSDGTTLIDLTADTVTANVLASGYTAHDKSGAAITGTNTYDADTSDATALPTEILLTKTAYVNGIKLTGSMPNKGAISGTISKKAGTYVVPQGYHDGSGTVAISSSEQNKIVATNIRKDITILGVTGTFSGSECPCITFVSLNEFTLAVDNSTKNWDGTIYYSTDAVNWAEWNGTTTLSSSGGKLYLRGTGNTRITGSREYFRWVLTGSNIFCVGNIETLLDYETVAAGNHPSMASFCYTYMFSSCTALTKAPELPATTLVNYCYAQMFRGCTALTTVPELPATTLAEGCYEYMFADTALTTVPELPATTLAKRCYTYMFGDCSKIKLSTTRTGEYQTAYRIPIARTGTTASGALTNMFANTGGTFTGTPNINTIYYTSNTVV